MRGTGDEATLSLAGAEALTGSSLPHIRGPRISPEELSELLTEAVIWERLGSDQCQALSSWLFDTHDIQGV